MKEVMVFLRALDVAKCARNWLANYRKWDIECQDSLVNHRRPTLLSVVEKARHIMASKAPESNTTV